MEQVFKVFLLLLLCQSLLVSAQSSYEDFVSLQSLTESWQNKPPSWVGSDPCGSGWEGIRCTNLRVTSIILASMNLVGKLSSDIQLLSELDTLDLSYNKGLTGTIPKEIGNLRKLKTLILVGCSFFGSIPDSIGSLQQLNFLALNSNQFSGNIPPTIGNLSNINWLDLSDNHLEGAIPISGQGVLGLEKLLKAKHFHMGNNRLSGGIPAQLFHSDMSLVHVLFDSNQLSGGMPSTIGVVNSLEAVRFDRNQLSGSVPSNISNLRNLSDLYLSNNRLRGPLPDLTGMNLLTYVDLSNNTFDSSDIPSWASSLPLMTTLKLENTNLGGQIPVSLFNQPSLETVVLKSNQLSGTLDIGNADSNRLKLIDLENNTITDFTQRNMNYKVSVVLARNRICLEAEASTERYCQESQSNSIYSTLPNNCSPPPCSSGQISSPNCKCSHPYSGTLYARALSFSDLGNGSYYKELELSLMTAFQSQNLPVDSVSLSNPFRNASTDYFEVSLKVFPSSSDRFNRTGVSNIAFVISSQLLKAPKFFLPYFFIADDYGYYAGNESKKSSHIGIIVGVVVAVVVFLAVALLAGIYVVRQKKRAKGSAELNPFANWKLNKNNGMAPQLKGARWFSLEELKKYTNNFSEDNTVGSGGYGKVYRAVLPTGELVAIKRAAEESMQGAVEFKTEIELLSRVHHKNLVGLAGFCFENGEQMLVYEYIPNGTLMDSLSGKSGIRMDWMRRLKVALGAARGLAYLHELANPPIIHRDIKSSNILLDEHLNAKVADFGLSKLLVDSERGHITTQVKGTMGYLDPEYYMTQQLTEKSDVYSFGVLMLELVTARRPIEKGKYIVREVQNVMDTTKELFNLHSIIDPLINQVTPRGLDKFVELAMRCVKEYAAERPSMAEVVKEIENIMELAGLNPASESDPTTEEIDVDANGGKLRRPYAHDEGFSYSGAFPSTKVEPQ
ncbi:probable leucine-rich repeat receptor-like protein kinase At5g49770 [Neltuma alba]|uniref:probable leucine-rich repeat receptor-like protein kinase At5g49770 n=1 Tax=Neltuma alba TaxID=207710 RepID=UPI0010A551C0|nr:probable leucine-rich repeat receptor-like protein kinase At5g49770 [Prosopis alba]